MKKKQRNRLNTPLSSNNTKPKSTKCTSSINLNILLGMILVIRNST